jgi:hypothetical protein
MSIGKIRLVVIPVVLSFGILHFMVLVRVNRLEVVAVEYALNNLRRIEHATKDYAVGIPGKMPGARDWADGDTPHYTGFIGEDTCLSSERPQGSQSCFQS